MDPDYSEIDFEYLPNGGWGRTEPTMRGTTWETFQAEPMIDDNITGKMAGSLAGWHTLVAQVAAGRVRYFVDGAPLADHGDKFYPEVPMSINFNLWFIEEGLTRRPRATELRRRHRLGVLPSRRGALATSRRVGGGRLAPPTRDVPRHRATVGSAVALRFLAARGARPGRFELPTTGSVDRCSIQLSYGRKMRGAALFSGSTDVLQGSSRVRFFERSSALGMWAFGSGGIGTTSRVSRSTSNFAVGTARPNRAWPTTRGMRTSCPRVQAAALAPGVQSEKEAAVDGVRAPEKW